ncbi:hypothetical protein IFT84_02265 [Rhizobium sp. CFBP 8762]|uniref:hypothetical protein n=1 Tax=Rhizobium sp. CFBP 8762 TaxID=2775279 RepID=UPI00177E0F94|nr:hypothetical protein [Rhizobium sp. CFBP 8762]MBD8553343.1 hypothetical protein [Rhizobium sp. CFBP 8762]
MRMTRVFRAKAFRICASLTCLLSSAVVLSGCVGPTYGTDKTAGAQLVDDLGSVASLGQGDNKAPVKYQPRPGLVQPPKGGELVQPQQSVAGKDNPQWIESPEDTRRRLIDEADANQGNRLYRSPLLTGGNSVQPDAVAMDPSRAARARTPINQQMQTFRQARSQQESYRTDERRLLSDPPVQYRKLPDGAEADLGTPEKDKEKRRKKEAEMAKSGNKGGWWPF